MGSCAHGVAFCISSSKQDIWLLTSKWKWNTFQWPNHFCDELCSEVIRISAPLCRGFCGDVLVAFATLKLESMLWLPVPSWVYVGELTFADWNVENTECIKDVFWVLPGDLAEEKHDRGEMQPALFMSLWRVHKWTVLLRKHEFYYLVVNCASADAEGEGCWVPWRVSPLLDWLPEHVAASHWSV